MAASSEKTTNNVMQHVQVKTKSKHRTLGWLTLGRSRSKNKYVLEDAEPHNGYHPEMSPNCKTDDELEEDVPTLLERLKVRSLFTKFKIGKMSGERSWNCFIFWCI